MQDCLFCKIIAGDIPANKVYENEAVFCFADIAPQAPVHVLVVPKRHVADITEGVACEGMLQQVAMAAVEVAKITGVEKSGFRTVMNTGADARQSVRHLHMHVLGGGELKDTMA